MLKVRILLMLVLILRSEKVCCLKSINKLKYNLKLSRCIPSIKMSSEVDISSLKTSIASKGDEIKVLKSKKPPTLKEDLAPLVSELISLKSKYKELTGEEFGGGGGGGGGAGATKKKEETKPVKESSKMEDLINLCKTRGFVFQSSEIYSSMPGFFDFGPLGVELKNNIKKLWWRDMVQRREDIVGLDCSIIGSPAVWKASGHVDGFSDPMVDCKESKLRFRADQVFWAKVETVSGLEIGYVSVMETNTMQSEALTAAMKLAKKADNKEALKPLDLKDLTKCPKDILPKVPSPATGEPGHLTEPRDFNLMFQTNVGAMSDASTIAYLRPETAQGIFTNFLSVQRTARMKIPFGIAQIGKAFRNEITPRNFIFRSREFEQMEIEYFIPPEDDIWQSYHEEWIEKSWNWLKSIGLKENLMFKYKQTELAHYARACTDITFQFPFGVQELMGIAARGNFDLSAHGEASGKVMEYFDDESKRKYVPHVIEPSIGVDRLFLALLTSAYDEDTIDGEPRKILRFHPAVAPVKVAVYPLVKNKPEIIQIARDLFEKLQMRYNCEWDTSGTIGKRYRRSDENGTPYCITVDYESITDGSVTVRDRDTTQQTRMKISDLFSYFSKEIDGL